MAVTVFCDNPKGLLNEIKANISSRSIETWQVDSDGDFTHSPPQWNKEAWFRPVVGQDKLVFMIVGQKAKRMSKTTYGVYHGRFIEMLLTHFDLKFNSVTASALALTGEWVGPPS